MILVSILYIVRTRKREGIMRKLLIKIFIPNYEDINDPEVRGKYGKLAGMVGIFSNLLLCISKVIVGTLVNSISIIADGINNLADGASSIITLIGFKLAAKPSDQEHPYGHARMEYVAGLVVSILIIVLGIQLLFTSFDKILNPEPLYFSYIIIIVLLLSIGIKIWQALFNFKTGKEINSTTLKATGVDSKNDVIATSAVLLGVLIGRFADLQLDGYIGCLVAGFIIYSGIQLIQETSSPLLGKAADPELVKEIQNRICSHEGIYGIHDLAVHDYGPGRIFATVHIEVDSHGDLIESHDLIDNIERTISKDLKIHLVAHMDPIETQDPLTLMLHDKITSFLKRFDGVIGIHDLRVVSGYTHNNVIFDVVISPSSKLEESHIKEEIENHLNNEDNHLGKKYFTVITFDTSYVENNI